jgi:hypothetical protein
MSKDLTRNLPPSDANKLDQILIVVNGLDIRLEKADVRSEGFELRLSKLEQTVDQKLYDTRPIYRDIYDHVWELELHA